MQSSDDVPVLVLGGLLSALGAERSLGPLGVRCHSAGDPAPFVRWSRYDRRLPRDCRRPVTPDSLAPYLRSLPVPRAVLMPCADQWVRAVSALEPDLRERFPASMPARDAVEVFLDKAKLLEALVRFDVPRPATRRARAESDLSSIESGGESAWFLKPVDSQRFKKRFGVKALRVRALDEAVARLREIHGTGLEVLLQEYVPGGADRHYFVDGFMDREGRASAVFARRRIRMHPPDFGDSSYMRSVPPEETAAASNHLLRLLEGVGYRGIFSAEFKHDPRDGVFRLIEVNVRPWAYVEFTTRCGVNTPWMAYRDALGLAVTPVEAYETGRAEYLLPQDALACRHLRRKGDLRLAEALRSWREGSDVVFRWSDPLPAVARHALSISPARFLRKASRPPGH